MYFSGALHEVGRTVNEMRHAPSGLQPAGTSPPLCDITFPPLQYHPVPGIYFPRILSIYWGKKDL